MITVSIVIYKTPRQMLDRAVKSVLGSPLVANLYLIDNSPKKLDVNYVDPRVEYFFTGRNLGYSKAHNLVLLDPKKREKYHLVMNPDVWFNPGSLEALYIFIEQRKDAGLVIPKILNPNKTVQYQCRMLPTPYILFARRFLPYFLYRNMNKTFEMRFSGYNKIMEVPYINGSFMFFRGSVIEDIGGFDEKIFMYGEDLDLSRRVFEHSKVIFLPDVSVYHEHQRGSYKDLRLLYYHTKGICYYFSKWGWFFDKRRKKINKQILNHHVNPVNPV